MNFVFSKHALEQMVLRGLSKTIIEEVLSKPDEIIKQDEITIYQSIVSFIPDGNSLIRVFINNQTEPNIIITAYKTSKIKKYYEGKI